MWSTVRALLVGLASEVAEASDADALVVEFTTALLVDAVPLPRESRRVMPRPGTTTLGAV